MQILLSIHKKQLANNYIKRLNLSNNYNNNNNKKLQLKVLYCSCTSLNLTKNNIFWNFVCHFLLIKEIVCKSIKLKKSYWQVKQQQKQKVTLWNKVKKLCKRAKYTKMSNKKLKFLK